MKHALAVILFLISLSVFAQRKPSDFPLEPSPDNSNFETYSQKNGVNTRATMDGLRTYFAPVNGTTIGDLLPTGNAQVNQIIKNTTNGKVWFVDYNGDAELIFDGSSVDISEGVTNPGAAPGVNDPKVYLNTASGSLWTWNGTNWVDTNSGLVEGTGIDITAGTISNTSPDQVVNLAEGFGIEVTGVYPNFTIANTGASGLTTVATDATITGDGTPGDPLSVGALPGPYRTDGDAILAGLVIGNKYTVTADNPYEKEAGATKTID